MVHDFNLSKSGVGFMSIYEIGFLMIGWTFTVIIFYSMGVDSGYKEGRRAVQKFYEHRDKVRV